MVKGRLLSDIGGTARIYEGTFQGDPVVIKEAKDGRFIPLIQSEHNFLINPPIQPIKANFADYGIPTDWRVNTRFVKPIAKAITPALYDKGITVLEKVIGRPLINESENGANLKVPLKFHFASVMGYADIMRHLAKKDVALDSNIDTDLLMVPDGRSKTLDVVRIDCMPSKGGARSRSGFPFPRQNMEQVATDQVIEILNRLYPKNLTEPFLGLTIPALSGRFREGVIPDSQTFFDTLRNGLARGNWNDEFVSEGDNHRLRNWIGQSFS